MTVGGSGVLRSNGLSSLLQVLKKRSVFSRNSLPYSHLVRGYCGLRSAFTAATDITKIKDIILNTSSSATEISFDVTRGPFTNDVSLGFLTLPFILVPNLDNFPAFGLFSPAARYENAGLEAIGSLRGHFSINNHSSSANSQHRTHSLVVKALDLWAMALSSGLDIWYCSFLWSYESDKLLH